MNQIIIGSLLLSVLHAVIPNHWLPVLAIGRKEQWTEAEVTRVTLWSGLAHVVSTVLIGLVLAAAGWQLNERWTDFSHWVAPAILVSMGLFFIFQHYRHHHFHLHKAPVRNKSKTRIIAALVVAMFLSPCLEIEVYFLVAGSKSWWLVGLLALMYSVITVTGMVVWVRVAYKGVLKLNWHRLEHNAGIITGVILIATGVLSFFIN